MGDHKTRLLIVERSPGDARSTAGKLGESAYTEFDVATAATLDEGRRLAASHDPEVIALELSLPDSSGLATFMSVQQAASGRPIVVITTRDDSELGPAAVHAGAHDALDRSSSDGELLRRTLRYAAARGHADRQRRRSDRRLTSLYEAVPAAIFEMDTGGKLLSANRALLDMLGYRDLERVNAARAARALFADRAQAAALAARIVSEGSIRRAELALLSQSGATVDTLMNCVPVANDSGILRGYHGSLTDITEIKSLHRELLAARRHESMGKLTEGVAHSFKDLLSTVIGNLYLAQQQLPGDHAAAESLGLAYDAATRATSLTRRLATFAQQQELRPEPVDIGVLMREMEPPLRRTLTDAVELDMRPPAEPLCVRADRAQLENAIIGLAMNANEAMAGRGRLSIGARRAESARGLQGRAAPDAGEAEIVVSDSGHGIEPAMIGHVFEPFFTTRGDGTGRGLGLSMVQGFAVQSGGRVDVASEPGCGAEFRIALPLVGAGQPDAIEYAGDAAGGPVRPIPGMGAGTAG